MQMIVFQDKVLPFLINLDIEMVATEKLIRTNIDTARIGETKVDWLLKFNKCKVSSSLNIVNLTGQSYENRNIERAEFEW